MIERLEGRQLLSATTVQMADPIQAKYQELGGANGILGPALFTGEQPTPYGGGTYQEFSKGAIFYSPATGAHNVSRPAFIEWQNSIFEQGGDGKDVQMTIGLPTADESNDAAIPGASVVTFQHGHLWESAATGAHLTYGAIDTAYISLASRTDAFHRNLQADLGLPTFDERNVSGTPGERLSQFQNGTITWSATAGTQVTISSIFTHEIFKQGTI
jgi:uncharacterized protein with LGFP repeats